MRAFRAALVIAALCGTGTTNIASADPSTPAPAREWIVFRGNFEGSTQVYAVETAKTR